MTLRWQQDQGLIVVLPPRTTVKKAISFVNDNLPWVDARRHKWNEMLKRPDVPDLKPGGRLLYHGQILPVKAVADSRSTASIKLELDQLLVTNPDSIPDVNEALLLWVIHQARNELGELVAEYARTLGVQVNRLSIRNQRSRWGSWSSRGNMNLNWRLIMLPDRITRYVILHELNHSFHPNHSRAFWSSLELICPGCRQLREELKNFAYLLPLFRN